MADAEESTTIQLLDLPVELLEMVMSHLDLHHHKLMRGVSDEMKQISNSYILHRHRRHEEAHRERPAESTRNRDERIKLQIMRSISCYFVDEDSESDLALCLLYFHDKKFELKASHLTQFVVLFMRRKEQRFNVFDIEWKNRLSLRRFHYAMTVLGLVRQFKDIHIINLAWDPLSQSLVVDVPNTFIGVIDKVFSFHGAESNRRISFLAVLADLLFYEKTKTSYIGRKNFEGSKYTYIIQQNSKANRSPRTIITFRLDSPELYYFMRNFILGNDDPNTVVYTPPKPNYSIQIEVKSYQGPQFVYYGELNINVLKSSELNDFNKADPWPNVTLGALHTRFWLQMDQGLAIGAIP